jgi:malate synthase
MNARVIESPCKRERTERAIEVLGPRIERQDEVLTRQALELLTGLHRGFNARRLELLGARERRQAEFDAGVMPEFLSETAGIRASNWGIAQIPADLLDRRVEITGPVDRKMIINALNAPVSAFMADFEDSCSPTWENILRGHANLQDATRRTIQHVDSTGRLYRLAQNTATLIVRPRGWHLAEKHLRIDDQPVSASLFDFAVYLTNNAEALARQGTGPYFYLPKLESHLEARLWNDVFLAAEEALALARGAIKATVLIETLPAAFEMDEILFELREHVTGLNCGRWDYIFSFIKKFRNQPNSLLPDRMSVTMERHFLKSYVDQLIQVCHRRGAHAMGGMAAQIPIRGDVAANDAALARVRADKLREARAGHDGTWIAHPGLATIAREPFDALMHGPNQKHVLREDVRISAADLLEVPDGDITEAGLRACIRVGIQYIEAWLRGVGCVPLYHQMEDAATAEICRAQLWQCIRHEARTSEGLALTVGRFDRLLMEELSRIHDEVGADRLASGVFPTATRLFEQMVKGEEFEEFLTLRAYELLD